MKSRSREWNTLMKRMIAIQFESTVGTFTLRIIRRASSRALVPRKMLLRTILRVIRKAQTEVGIRMKRRGNLKQYIVICYLLSVIHLKRKS